MCHSMIGAPERLGHLLRQHGLAGARLALDQQRTLQRDRGVDRHAQVVGGNIGVGTGKFHDAKSRFTSVWPYPRGAPSGPQGRGPGDARKAVEPG